MNCCLMEKYPLFLLQNSTISGHIPQVDAQKILACLIASGILSSKQSLAKAPEPSFDHFHLGEFWQAFSLKIFCCKILILPRWLFVRSISSVLTLFKLSEKFLLYFAGGCLGQSGIKDKMLVWLAVTQENQVQFSVPP